MGTPRGLAVMLATWGYTWLLVAFVSTSIHSWGVARLAAELAAASFVLTLTVALAGIAFVGGRALVERRLEAAGTAWTPPSA